LSRISGFRKACSPVSADVFGELNKQLANSALQIFDTEVIASRKTIFGHDAMTLIRVTKHPKKLT
jgi:hypothetical protein